jgi:release factor glutamine methyltransferase
MIVGVALRQATRELARHLADQPEATPRLDAELLLAHVLGCGRVQLLSRWRDDLTSAEAEQFAALLARRAAHEPAAYLLGRRAFYDVELVVTRDVLIPRPETEHLVEAALAWAVEHPPRRVVDVGTGSGALAVTLARHLPEARVVAVDLSAAALAVAARNVARYGLAERVALLQADLLSALGEPCDLIVANLPYIPQAEIATLAPEVATYEPRLALDGGADGLALIRRLLAQAPRLLATPGLLLLDIDHRQADAVVALAAERLPGARVTVLRDLAGLPRVVRVERIPPAMTK